MIKVLAFPGYSNKNSNPYNYLLYSGMEENNVDIKEFSFKAALGLDYDLIHVHWPEFYLNSNYFMKAIGYSFAFLFCLAYSRLFGRKLVWTVHNLKPHKIKHLFTNNVFWFLFVRMVDAVISLSFSNENIIMKKNLVPSGVMKKVIYHGLYDGFYENTVSKDAAKNKLNIPQDMDVCLFIGQVKSYKNVEMLVELFSKEYTLKDTLLLIAGKFESVSYYNDIAKLASESTNIIIHNYFVPEGELQTYFNASDVCLLPFKEIFNSGSALLSASFNKPVLVPESDNFTEYSNIIPGNLICTYNKELTAGLISTAIKRARLDADVLGGKGRKIDMQGSLSWVVLQSRLAAYYKNIIQGGTSS